jgi:hypothetical protein
MWKIALPVAAVLVSATLVSAEDDVERAAWNCSGTIIKLTEWRHVPSGETEGHTDYIFHFESKPPKKFRIRMYHDGPATSEHLMWANGKPCQLVRQ